MSIPNKKRILFERNVMRFLHVPISQWSQREGEKFPFFEKLPFSQKLHGVITTSEMVDKRLQWIENGRLNLGQLTTTFNNPSFTRRTLHTSYPSPQFPPVRGSPHIPSPRPGPPRGGAGGENCPRSPTQRGPQNWKDLAWIGFDHMKWFLWRHK